MLPHCRDSCKAFNFFMSTNVTSFGKKKGESLESNEKKEDIDYYYYLLFLAADRAAGRGKSSAACEQRRIAKGKNTGFK